MARARLLALLGVLAATPAAAVAQPPGVGVPGGGNPAFSPYLNLLRGGNPTYLNYYGLVRPQLDFQQSLQGLQSQLSTTQSQLQAGPGAGGMHRRADHRGAPVGVDMLY